MAFPHDGKKFQPGISGNPDGKPKGALHLSTQIQNLLNDEEFAPESLDGKEFKGTPLKAIILTAQKLAIAGDNKWAEWLGKHGYGIKTETDITTKGEAINPVSTETVTKFAEFLKNETKQD